MAHRDELTGELERILATAPAAEWEARLARAGVPAGLVGDIGEAITRAGEPSLDPLLVLGPGRTPQIRHPARYATAATAPPSPPPGLGEHADLIRA